MEFSAISDRRSAGATDLDAEKNSYNGIGYGEKLSTGHGASVD
jgi:hypothetical protein